MDLIKVKGNSYYIQAPTSIGVYTFKNKNCMMVDTGNNNTSAKKIEDALIQNNLHPKYIFNTHGHLDHCGGNNYFNDNYPGIITYSTFKEKLFMENNDVVEYGVNKINDEKLEFMPLPGHSIEQAAMITPDKVCYLGDAVFSHSTLMKYPLPYYYNILETLNSLDKIKEIDCDYFVVSHGDKLYNKTEILELCNMNINNIHKYINDISEVLSQPLSKEEVLENIAVLNDINMNFQEYYINLSAISAFIAFLYNNGTLNFSIENGKLYYYTKEK